MKTRPKRMSALIIGLVIVLNTIPLMFTNFSAELDLGNLYIDKTIKDDESAGDTVFSFQVFKGHALPGYEVGAVRTIAGVGTITVEGLEPGTDYYVQEVRFHDDYVKEIGNVATGPITVAKGETDKTNNNTISFENEKKRGQLTIMKSTDVPGKSVLGAKFNIHFAEDGEDTSNDVTASITSGTSVAVSELRLGEYEITEIKAPDGFLLNETVYQVLLSSAGPSIVAERVIYVGCNITDVSQLGKFRIIKENSTTNEMDDEMIGTVFNIYPSNKTYSSAASNEKQQLTINAANVSAGYAETISLPLGEYIIEEIKAPAGYILDAVTYQTVTLKYYPGLTNNDNYEAVEVMFTNTPQLGQITVYKTGTYDKTNGAYGESDIADGAEFEIRSGSAEGPVVDTLVLDGVTSKESRALPIGTYYVIETKAPTGYTLDVTPQEVVITYNAEKQDLEVLTENDNPELKVIQTNEVISGKIFLTKYSNAEKDNSEIGLKVLEGVKFQVYLKSAGSYDDANENERDEITTDENGCASTKDLPYGTYVVREVEVPKDYICLEGDLKLYPGGDLADLDWDVKKYDNADKVSEINISSNDQTYCYALVNKLRTGGLKIVKTFEDVTTDEDLAALAGIVFAVQGNPVQGKPYFETFKTNEKGIIEINDLLPGEYKVREMKCGKVPLKYSIAPEESAVVEAGVLKELPIENKLFKGEVSLTKVGSNDLTKPLSGAEFKVYEDVEEDENFNEELHFVGTMVEGEDTVYRLDGLVCGKYYVKEVKAPDGYEKDLNKHEFEISRDSEVVVVNEKGEESKVFVNELLTTEPIRDPDSTPSQNEITTVPIITEPAEPTTNPDPTPSQNEITTVPRVTEPTEPIKDTDPTPSQNGITTVPITEPAEPTKDPNPTPSQSEPTKDPDPIPSQSEPTKDPALIPSQSEPTKDPDPTSSQSETIKDTDPIPSQSETTKDPTRTPSQSEPTKDPDPTPSQSETTKDPAPTTSQSGTTNDSETRSDPGSESEPTGPVTTIVSSPIITKYSETDVPVTAITQGSPSISPFSGGSPKTSDSSNMSKWVIIMLMSIVALNIIIIKANEDKTK